MNTVKNMRILKCEQKAALFSPTIKERHSGNKNYSIHTKSKIEYSRNNVHLHNLSKSSTNCIS